MKKTKSVRSLSLIRETGKMNELKIGGVVLDSPFLLAPLSGFTDAPMRRICREMGAAMVYSEMISGKGLYYGNYRTRQLLRILGGEKPVAYQIFGSEPEIMAWAARALDDRDNAVLDINMGCPVPKVVKNGEGSALLKDPGLIYDIVSAVTKNTSKPVTVKIRTGFDNKTINAVETARAAEAGGAAAVAVHARTREQYYSGKADWKQIALVKKALRIPVIGNGDVTDGESGMAMLKETGCDFVMVGRGALGNPWIFRELLAAWRGDEKPARPALDDRKEMFLRHFRDIIDFKGEYAAVREIRKFAGWYFKGVPGGAALRGKVNQVTGADALIKVIREL